MRPFFLLLLALTFFSCGSKRKRPQEPVLPLPYQANEVIFTSQDGNVTLSGTLTTPEKDGVKTAVVLLSGSGPDNRDYENQFDHKPFLVLSDYLTRRGISVLRYDERGVGKSEGDYPTATYENLMTDAVSAVKFLKERGFDRIGVIGHSEGGGMAPLVALNAPVNFLVLMAPDNATADLTLFYQTSVRLKSIAASKTVTDEVLSTLMELLVIVKTEPDRKKAKEKMEALVDRKMNQGSSDYKNISARLGDSNQLINGFLDEKFIYRLNNDPKVNLQKLRIPVLVLFGDIDLVVDVDTNLRIIESALDSTRHEVKVFPGLGHLFMNDLALPAEYIADLEQTLDLDVLVKITDWIKADSE